MTSPFHYCIVSALVLLSSSSWAQDGRSHKYSLYGEMTEARLNRLGSVQGNAQKYHWKIEVDPENGWGIYATNIVYPAWKARVVFDGTNNYFFQPSVADVTPSGAVLADSDLDLAAVNFGDVPLLESSDTCHLLELWLIYLAKEDSATRSRLVAWPVVGWSPRKDLRAWGFSWRAAGIAVDSLLGGNYFSKYELARNTTLDLESFEQAIKMDGYVYPEDIDELERARMQWNMLKLYSSNSIAASIEINGFNLVEGKSVPSGGVVSYFGPGVKPHKFQVINVKLNDIVRETKVFSFDPVARVETRVDDFRYSKRDSIRQMSSVGYLVPSGGKFVISPDDKHLNAEAQIWMEKGPTLKSFKFTVWKVVLYVGFAILVVASVIGWRFLSKKGL